MRQLGYSSRTALVLCVGGMVAGALMPEPSVAAPVLGLLPLLLKLVWRPGETPVLAFAITFQWMQVSAVVFRAMLLGVDLDAAYFPPRTKDAVWLGLGALLTLALGIRVALRRFPLVPPSRSRQEADRFSAPRIFCLYLGFAGLGWVLPELTWRFLPIAQLLLALADLRWVFLFLLGAVVLRQRRYRWLFGAALALEFIAGIGFFSGFKRPLFIALLVLFSARPRISWRNSFVGLTVVLGVGYLMLAWTAIKVSYRAYLNQGSHQQTVAVSRSESLIVFAEAISQVDLEEVLANVDPMLSRLAYVGFFARVLDYVPAVATHTHGAIWGRSIMNVLEPRMLFPGKPIVASSSELTMKYTGLVLASSARGTSISMGYVAESYIDFGFMGMWLPILALGITWGLFYRYLLIHAPGQLGFAFASAVLIEAYQFEMSGIMLLGGVLTKFLVFALLIRLLLTDVRRWLQPAATRSSRAHHDGAPSPSFRYQRQ